MDRGLVIPTAISRPWPESCPIYVPEGCVLALDFAEPAGTRHIDHSGFANHASVTGAALVGAPAGYCRIFDGVDDLVSCAAAGSLDLTTQGSIEVWAKSNRSYPSDDGTSRYRGMVCKASGGTAAGIAYYLDWYGTNAARTLRVSISNGTTQKSASINGFDFGGAWKHIVAAWDPSFLYLYVNGVLIGAPVANTVAAQVLAAQPLHVGRNFSTGTSTYTWDGWMAQVALFNRALAPGEILNRFRADAWRFGIAA